MEIIYELSDINDLKKPEIPENLNIRWTKTPDDYQANFQAALDRKPDYSDSLEQ
ncbi:hypothetical protein FACS1894219_10550 [Clostridia bacterium]|nr:hypothetical protein FACS1894219_10550 [Clostridia bacterium]